MNDSFIEELDVVSINKYMGWYHAWPSDPSEVRWNVALGKPLIFSLNLVVKPFTGNREILL